MTRSLIFWVLMLLWLLFGIFGAGWFPAYPYHAATSSVLLFVLLLLLGWQVYGPPIKG